MTTILDSRWSGDGIALSALAERREKAAKAALTALWSQDNPKGHDDPEVRTFARAYRMSRVWGGQLHDLDAPWGEGKERDAFHATLARWSGWPDLPRLVWGDCADCANGLNGRERGYSFPCSACKRPSHSHYLPRDPREPIKETVEPPKTA